MTDAVVAVAALAETDAGAPGTGGLVRRMATGRVALLGSTRPVDHRLPGRRTRGTLGWVLANVPINEHINQYEPLL